MIVQEVDLSMIELLQRITPTIHLTKMDKKQRNKRNKNSRQMRRKRVAVAVDDGTGVRADFVFDPDRPWETGKTLTEFRLFKKLAPELRQMIWAECLPGAQAIKISADGYNTMYKVSMIRRVHRHVYRAKATYHPSPLLFVNRESRAILTSKNPLAFATQLGGRPIRFNFSRDILYFDDPMALINFYGGTLPLFRPELEKFGFVYDMSEVHDKVQHVAVGNIRLYKGTIGGTLNQFKALKTVILGGASGEDTGAPYDMVVDLMTGDERLIFGWERFQNFKTPEDNNMPSVERYRKDQFDRLVLKDYAVCSSSSVVHVNEASTLR